MPKRVAVTGMGFVTPIGQSPEAVWASLREGRSGVGPLTRFEVDGYSSQIAGEVRDFDPTRFLDRKAARNYGRFIQYAVAAAQMAVDDSGLALAQVPSERTGVIIGTAFGGLEQTEDSHRSLLGGGVRRVSPFTIPMLLPNMAPAVVAIQVGAGGPNYSVASACASSGHAIGDACDLIRLGRATAVLAGGSEAPITPLSVAGFCQLKAMSTRNSHPAAASRPFDKGRDGFVIAEGAVVMVLEDMEHALARGARIWAEVAGHGAGADRYHYVAPDPEGAGVAQVMGAALADANLAVEELGYINAHATSTPEGDVAEARAIRRFLGARVARVPVSSTKSVTGHLIGSAGALGAAAAIFALRDQTIPPTINLDDSDPECDLDLVPNQARPASLEVAMVNSFGFGGQNSSLVLKRV